MGKDPEPAPLFVSGKELSVRIRKVTSGSNLRCAVAFWGLGASSCIPKRTLRTARIVCDLSMGGTNPSELRKLGAPRSPRLKHLPGLHAKAYLSDFGAVIGSANASEGGIGFSSDATLIEAGVFLQPQTDAFKTAEDWFERVFKRAATMSDKELTLAESKWEKRSAAAIITGFAAAPNKQNSSVLDLAIAMPEVFGECGFVITNTLTTKPKRKEAIERDREAFPNQPLEKYEQFTDWGREFYNRWPNEFIELWLDSSGVSAISYRKVLIAPERLPKTLYAEKLKTGALYELINRRKRPDDEPIRALLQRNQTFFGSAKALRSALKIAAR